MIAARLSKRFHTLPMQAFIAAPANVPDARCAEVKGLRDLLNRMAQIVKAPYSFVAFAVRAEAETFGTAARNRALQISLGQYPYETASATDFPNDSAPLISHWPRKDNKQRAWVQLRHDPIFPQSGLANPAIRTRKVLPWHILYAA